MAISDGYIAGFFDGEGSVCSYLERRRSRNSVPKPHISMAQKNNSILYEIREYLGYGVVWRNRLTIRGKANVTDFANRIGPHLRIKHRQIELARLMAQRVNTDNSPVPARFKRERVIIANRIRALNHE